MANQHLPGEEVWLVREERPSGERKYYLSNLPAEAALKQLASLIKAREATKLGPLTVEDRQITGWRNDTNIVRLISPEWLSWLRLTRKRKDEALTLPHEGGECKSVNPTPTSLQERGKLKPAEPLQGLPRGSGRPQRGDRVASCQPVERVELCR
ncbi:hypothetical protein DHODJN_25980 [Methylorubrum extorquens]